MNLLYHLIKWLSGKHFVSRLLATTLHHLDSLPLKLTRNQHSFTSLLTGLPVVVLATTGSKSGRLRTTPLVALLEDDKVILIASSFGNTKNPGWYHNLKASPQVKILWNSGSGTYLAREVDGDERENYWQKAVRQYSGYAEYQVRAGSRRIPVISLEPV